MEPEQTVSPAEKRDIISVHYSRDVGWSGHKAAELVRTGLSTLITSYDEGQRPAIGTFQRTLDAQIFQGLTAAVEEMGHIRMEELLQPGARVTSIGVRAVGAPTPKTVATFLAVPPKAEGVVNAIEATLSELKKHPTAAIEGTFRTDASELMKGERWSFSLRLTNIGTKSVSLLHPASQGADWTGIRVRLWDPKKQDGAPQLDVNGRDILSAEPAAQSDVFTLATGQALVVNAQVMVDVSPGTYTTRLEVHLFPRQGTVDHVSGMVAIDGGDLKVTAGGR
jgi:hypothetical protein